jgi:uncharacterized protein YutE (UPF0331/DUF86 family)
LRVLDRERILAKLDELDGYVRDLQTIAPQDFAAYRQIEKKRACERLLQIAVECVIDVCNIMVSGLRLGLPAEENDLFEKLEQAGILSSEMKQTVQKMKGFRNILVHEYGYIDDIIVYQAATTELHDFAEFKREILIALSRR